MNSPDPWRSIIGSHHHHGGGGGGGHHGHGGHHRPRDIPGYSYGYGYPYYYDEPTVLVDNRQYLEPVWNPYTGQWEYPAPPDGYGYGSSYVQGALAEPPRARDGLLAEIAPVLAPATGGVIANLQLGQDMKLSGYVQVDGVTYQGAVDLAPVINALLVKMRTQAHAGTAVGGGGCGARLYYGVTENKMGTILKRLAAEGAKIAGPQSGPWQMQISKSKGPITVDIEMTGRWNPQANTLLIEVTDTSGAFGLDVCGEVWETIDKHMRGVGASSTPMPPPQQSRSPGRGQPSGPSRQPMPQAPQQTHAQQPPQNVEQLPTVEEVVQAIDRAVAAARQSMIESLVQQHVNTVASGWLDAISGDDSYATMSAGWFSSLKNAAKKAARGLEKGIKAPAGSIAATLKKYRGPIASAAGFAAAGLATAIPGAGVALGPVAGNLAQKLTLAAAGEGSAKKALMQARDEAKQDPKLAKALGAAEKAVAQTTAAYHIAETARAASTGNADAAKEMEKLATKAQEGDKAAQVAMQLANKATSPDGAAAPTVSGDYEVMMREIAKKAIRGGFRQRGGKYAMEPGFGGFSRQVLGYRRDGNRERVYFLDSLDDAQKWFDSIASDSPDYVTYVARDSIEQAGPTGPMTFLTERWSGGPIESVASVNGLVQIPGQRTDIKRIEVLDEDGNLTKRAAIYTKPGPLPDYFVELQAEAFWMFFDPTGTEGPISTEGLGPNAPADLAGKRYRKEYPAFPPLVMVAGSEPFANVSGDCPGVVPGYRREDGTWVPTSGPQFPPIVGTGGPRVLIIGEEAKNALASIRKQASDAAGGNDAGVLGVVRWADGNWSLEPLKSVDEADDWFGYLLGDPSKYVYAAYYDKADRTFPGPVNESVGTGAFNKPAKPAPQPIPRGVATVEGCP